MHYLVNSLDFGENTGWKLTLESRGKDGQKLTLKAQNFRKPLYAIDQVKEKDMVKHWIYSSCLKSQKWEAKNRLTQIYFSDTLKPSVWYVISLLVCALLQNCNKNVIKTLDLQLCPLSLPKRACRL